MRRTLVLSALVSLLLIIWAGIPVPAAETRAQAAQTTGTPTPEATEPGYTNYSGYYRMRCWPACHSKDLPASMMKTD